MCKYTNILTKLRSKYNREQKIWYKCMLNNFRSQRNRLNAIDATNERATDRRAATTELAPPSAEEISDIFQRIQLNEIIDDAKSIASTTTAAEVRQRRSLIDIGNINDRYRRRHMTSTQKQTLMSRRPADNPPMQTNASRRKCENDSQSRVFVFVDF